MQRWRRQYSVLFSPIERLARLREILHQLDDQHSLGIDSLARLLQTCTNLRALHEGRRLHAHIAARGMDSNPMLGVPLLSLYYKCGALGEARAAFDRLESRGVVAWTVLVGAYAQNGQPCEAFATFRQMQLEGVRPNEITLVAALNACTSPGDLPHGETLRAIACDLGMDSVLLLSNALITMYSKCGSLDDARRVFDSMEQRDVITWTSIISALSRYEGFEGDAIRRFHCMQLEGLAPNAMTLSIVLNSCARAGDVDRGAVIHTIATESGVPICHSMGTALVNLYGRAGRTSEAVRAFNSMRDRTVVAWNALIAVHIQNRAAAEAVHVYRRMAQEGFRANKVTFVTVLNACESASSLREGRRIHESIKNSGYADDVIVANALINMYDSCGSLSEAERVFEGMGARNTISWNAMLTACSQHKRSDRAKELLRRMMWEGSSPSRVTFVTMLNACGNASELQFIHSLVAERGDEFDTIVGSALVNLHGKYGSVVEARRIFDGMSDRDVVAWNGMIAAYAHAAYLREAMDVFQAMQDQEAPNDVTLITMLEACTNEVDLEAGMQIHAMVPDFYHRREIGVGIAIVNLYGKCGRVQQAKQCFDLLPYRDVVLWTSLIAAFAQHGDPHEAVRLVKVMQQEGIEPNSITLVSVLAACSHAGLVEEAHHYFLTISRSREVEAMEEHYRCVVDLLARAGRLDEAEGFLKRAPLDPGPVAWLALLSACKRQGDVARAKRAAALAIRMCPASSAGYVALSNAFAGLEEEEEKDARISSRV